MNLKTFAHLFKSVDLFTRPVQLLIKREEGHKTMLGAWLSLILIVIMAIFFINSVILFYDRSKPITLTTEVYHQEPELYELHPGNFTLQFAFQDSTFATYIDESIYIVEANLVKKIYAKYDISNYSANGSQEITYQYTQLPLVTCSKEIIKQEALQDYFSLFDLDTNYCIDWNKIDKINMQGTFDSYDYQYILFQFRMCNENTRKKDGPECKTTEEIQKAVSHNYLSLQMSSYYIDLQNPGNPYIPKGQDSFTTISSQIYKEITIYLQPVTTHTDDGAFFQSESAEKTLQYMELTEMIDFNDSDLLANIAIRLNTIEKVNYRQYSRIQTILAELGGLWNVLFTIAMLLQIPVSAISYKLQIVNSLFNFEGNSEIIEDEHENINLPFTTEDAPIISNKKSSKIFAAEAFNNKNQSLELQFTGRRQIASPLRGITPIKKSKFQRQDSVRSSFRSSAKVHQKLQELQQQCMKIQNTPTIDDENLKSNQTHKLNQQVKGFFQTVSKKLEIPFFKYLLHQCKINKEDQQIKQFQFSVSRMQKSFDILYVIKKLHEIDKLKMILLNKDQIKLFDYLPKPTISTNPDNEINAEQYFSILKPIKSNFQVALEAQHAFREISQRLDDPINKQLINCMDENILEFLQLQLRQSNEDNEPNEINDAVLEDQKEKITQEDPEFEKKLRSSI